MSIGYDLALHPRRTTSAVAAYQRRRAARAVRANGNDQQQGLPSYARAFSTDGLLESYDQLRREGGQAPGNDGVTYRDLSRREAAHLLRAMSASVLSGAFRPQATRSVPIPKASGGMLVLQIGTILDRVVARRLLDAVTREFEQQFLPKSYGFRPLRHVWHQLAEQEARMHALDAWVVTEDDVAQAFDSVNIAAVRDDIAQVIIDPQYLGLIDCVLRGSRGPQRTIGIDQGCPFSPLALNAHLHRIHDLSLDPEGELPYWARYADNLVYLTRNVSDGHRARQRAADLLQQFGLALKGPGAPTDLRTGEPVSLLGLNLQLRNGTISCETGDDSYQKLELSLNEAHMADDPPMAARQATIGWVYARGPAFESSVDDATSRILGLCAHHGFRNILTKDAIRVQWKEGHAAWTSTRERAFRRMNGIMSTLDMR